MPVPTKLIDRNFGLLVFYEVQKVNELLSNIFKLLYNGKVAISIYSLLITLSLIYLVIKSNKFYR